MIIKKLEIIYKNLSESKINTKRTSENLPN